MNTEGGACRNAPPEYIDRVPNHGERLVLKKADEPIPEITPNSKPRTLAEALMLLNLRAPLTDEEAADFERDINEMRPPATPVDASDPWES